MSSNTAPAAEREIVETIRNDAETQAQNLIESARALAGTETQKLRQEGESLAAAIIEKARLEAARAHAREIATARIEARRILLRAREQAVARILDQAGARLEAARERPDEYRRRLIGLAAEAVRAVGGEAAVLVVSKADAPLLDAAFLDAVQARVNAASNSPAAVRLQYDENESRAGCKAMSPDGRIQFDNTFRRRLERVRGELRTRLVEEMLKRDE